MFYEELYSTKNKCTTTTDNEDDNDKISHDLNEKHDHDNDNDNPNDSEQNNQHDDVDGRNGARRGQGQNKFKDAIPEFTAEELQKAIGQLKTGKAKDKKGLVAEMLKE